MDVQQMIQDRVKKVEEIKRSLELNKVSPPQIQCAADSFLYTVVPRRPVFSGQRSGRDPAERAGLLRAGAIHPEDSGRAGSGHGGEAEADGEVGRGSHL